MQHIGIAEELLTWFLIALGFVGVAYMLATWIIDHTKDYPHDDDL